MVASSKLRSAISVGCEDLLVVVLTEDVRRQCVLEQGLSHALAACEAT